jgi:parallel beta-helix repeat protein
MTLLLVSAILAGCEDPGTKPSSCVQNGAICAGVDEGALGTGAWYVDGATCSRTLYVREGATGGTGTEAAPFGDLPEAAAVTTAGDCIALAAGQYAGAELSGSVSLLGKGSTLTTVTGVGSSVTLRLTGGSGGLIRGLRVSGDGRGIVLERTAQVVIESVEILGTVGAGMQTVDATDVTLRHLHVADVRVTTDVPPVAAGISSVGGSGITVEASLVERTAGTGILLQTAAGGVRTSVIRDNQGYGIAAACESSTACETPPSVTVAGNRLSGNAGVGIWLSGVQAVVQSNQVTGTIWKGTVSRGIEVQNCADVRIEDNDCDAGDDFGLLLHRSSGQLTGNAVRSNEGRGIWIQNLGSDSPDQVVALAENLVEDNRLIGVGANGRVAIDIVGGRITGTREVVIMLPTGGFAMGDGAQGLPDSTVNISGVHFERNDRVAVLADDVTSFTVSDCVFGTESLADGVIVYNTDPGLIASTGNTTVGSVMVVPNAFMPEDPLEYDKSEVALSAAANALR